MALNAKANGVFDVEKKRGGGNKRIRIANWCIDARSLETFQPSSGCTASNSPEERQRASGRTKQKEESETVKDRGFFLPPLLLKSAFFLYLLKIKQVKTDLSERLLSRQIQLDTPKKKLQSRIFLLSKYPLLLHNVLFSWVSLSVYTVFILTLSLLKLKSSFSAMCQRL